MSQRCILPQLGGRTQEALPPPCTVEQIPGGYKVLDAAGQSLAYVRPCDRRRRRNVPTFFAQTIGRKASRGFGLGLSLMSGCLLAEAVGRLFWPSQNGAILAINLLGLLRTRSVAIEDLSLCAVGATRISVALPWGTEIQTSAGGR